MKQLVVLGCLFTLGSASDCQTDSAPSWPDGYSVSGVLQIPYSEVNEPFDGFFDGNTQNSRIDYYGGTDQTYRLHQGEFGTTLRVVPITTETETNVRSCFQVNGTSDQPIKPQSVLPDLTGFTCSGIEQIDGTNAEKWINVVKIEEKVNSYTMHVFRQEIDGVLFTVPVRYEMKGFDSLLGSHFDHYYLTYSGYVPVPPSPEVFKVDPNLTCGDFPDGPGAQTGWFNPMKEFIHGDDSHVEHAWNDFKTAHKKQYESTEHDKRRRIFRDNHRFIQSHNRKGLSYKLAINHMADWDESERKAIRGRRHSGASNDGLPFPYKDEEIASQAAKLPESMDWRLYGAVTPVKDQSVCGSCWSFGTTGSLEGAYFLKTGILVSLSQQALMDCSWGFGNNACDGGEDWRAYQWIIKHGGLPLSSDYGDYLGADGKCHVDQVNLVAPITGYVNVTSNDESALKLALLHHGPISVSVDASTKTFDFFSNGVYSDPQCKSGEDDLDHSVLLVGYGTLYGKRYWLIKNSWSNMWGNDGFILIASENNICGVMTIPHYVNM